MTLTFLQNALNLPYKPVMLYDGKNPDSFLLAKKQLAEKNGIYGWVHKKSLKTYVGSSFNLGVRPFKHLLLST